MDQYFTVLSAMLLVVLATITDAAPAGASVLYIPAAIASPPHAGTVNFTRLRNAISLDYGNTTELYVKVVESEQAVQWIMSAMVRAQLCMCIYNSLLLSALCVEHL